MSDPPDDPDAAIGPFPRADEGSPFPPLHGEAPVEPDVAFEGRGDWNAGADAHDLSIAHRPVRERPLTPLAALGRFAFPPAPPPDEEGVAARDRRWTSRAIMIAVTLLLVFNAVSIQNWVRQQPPGWITATVQQLADVWTAQIAQLGADRPRQTIRDAYRQAREARFPGQAPPPPV